MVGNTDKTFKHLSDDELHSAAEQGWQTSFDGKNDPMYFVSVSGKHAFIKAGKQVIKVLSIGQPHLPGPRSARKRDGTGEEAPAGPSVANACLFLGDTERGMFKQA